jgi:hypothetical protein
MKQGFWSRYKKYVIALVLIWVILTLVLLFLSSGDRLPFEYQVF